MCMSSYKVPLYELFKVPLCELFKVPLCELFKVPLYELLQGSSVCTSSYKVSVLLITPVLRYCSGLIVVQQCKYKTVNAYDFALSADALLYVLVSEYFHEHLSYCMC